MKKLNWNYNFFEEETSKTAYWAGFLMGDGWITSRGKSYRFGVGLAEKDKEHLKIFCNHLSLNDNVIKIKENKIRNKIHNLYYFELTDKNLYKQLSKWGIIFKKTDNFITPNIKDELIGDYIRGWFDADGCSNLNGETTKQINLCGNPQAIQYFENSLYKLGFNKNICRQNKGKIDVSIISSFDGINQFYKICKGNDQPRLERKWSLIESYIGV